MHEHRNWVKSCLKNMQHKTKNILNLPFLLLHDVTKIAYTSQCNVTIILFSIKGDEKGQSAIVWDSEV